MGYYQGDYYMAGPPVAPVPSPSQSGASKFGNIFSGIDWGRVARETVSLGASFLPGVGGAAAKAVSAFGSTSPAMSSVVAQAMAGGGRRRYRRMNVTNVRALRRGMRRVQGFAKLARQTIGFTQRVKMKRRRRR